MTMKIPRTKLFLRRRQEHSLLVDNNGAREGLMKHGAAAAADKDNDGVETTPYHKPSSDSSSSSSSTMLLVGVSSSDPSSSRNNNTTTLSIIPRSILSNQQSKRVRRQQLLQQQHQSSSSFSLVRFGRLQIHSHAVVLGDNPSVSSGLPWALGDKVSEDCTTVEDYEYYRPCRRPWQDLLVRAEDRAEHLRIAGYGRRQLRQTLQEIKQRPKLKTTLQFRPATRLLLVRPCQPRRQRRRRGGGWKPTTTSRPTRGSGGELRQKQ